MMMFGRGWDHVGNYCSGLMMNPWGILIGVLAVIAVVVLVVVLVKAPKNRGSAETDEAIELLNTKYAAGEITEEEYLRKKKILSK